MREKQRLKISAKMGLFLKSLMVILILFFTWSAGGVYADDGCTDIPKCNGESLDYYMYDRNTEVMISDGQVVPVKTSLAFHLFATAYGECETLIPSCSPSLCLCVIGPVYERNVNHARVQVDIVSEGPLNGAYMVGSVFCQDPVTHATKFYQELESGTELCPAEPSMLLYYPGIYNFTLRNIINNPLCLYGVCPADVQMTATVYAGEPVNDHCNTVIGDDVGVASGISLADETDFSIPGIMPVDFTRYYNSKTAQGPGRGFGKTWGHIFDTKIDTVGTNLYKITNPDGSVFYYSDINSDAVYEAVIPKGETSSLIMEPDNSFKRIYKDGNVEEYNPSGYMTSVKDKNTNIISLSRDTANRLTSITGPKGRVITLAYDTSDRISQITVPDGKIISYQYSNNRLQRVIYPDGTYKTYEYFSIYLTGIKNEKGQYIKKYTYDNKYRVSTSSADGTNEKVTINYVDSTHTTVTDSLGRVTTYTIDKFGGKNHATDITGPGCKACGQGDVAYTYDDKLNITSTTDANGNVTAMTYDANGNMLTKTAASGTADARTTTYTYNEQVQPLTVTDHDGNTTTYTYDANGNLLEETDAQGNATTHTYNSYGERLTTTDPNGGTTTYTYDAYGNLATVTNDLNQTTSFTYDIMGNLISMTDANGNTTTYEYDLRSRLVKETKPEGGEIIYEYDLAGNRTAVNDANGNRTTFTYDTINRLIKTTDPEGNSTNYTYDTEGNIITTTIKDSLDNVMTSITNTYDDHNRLTRTTHLDGTYTEQTYDALGNVLTKRDENGIVTNYAYDALNRLSTVTDTEQGVTPYTYDSRDNLLTVTDANGNTTTYTYDSLNRIVSTTSPDTGVTTYTYDANGNMLTKTDSNGVTTTYTYDTLNRQTAVQFPDPSQNITYTYDEPQYQNGIGRLSTMTDPSGSTVYEYDKTGRVKRELKQVSGLYYNTEYTYDLNGNLIETNYPGGRAITYTYNQTNKVSSVTETQYGVTNTLASDITYMPFGDMVSMIQGNEIVTTRTYDNRYHLSGLNIGTIKLLSYTRDDVGNITAITDNLDPTKTKSYTYDNLYRLTAATGPWGGLTYAYDSVGNRTNETTDTGNTAYSYMANTNKLASATGEESLNFDYDNDGNTTAENSRQYVYNQNQRLIQAVEGSNVLGEYVYNGNGQRVKKYTNNGTQCTVYHYDKNGLLTVESSSSGMVKAEYIFLNGQPLAKIENNNIYYYHNDHLGTSMLMTDENQSVVWEGDYLPFGKAHSVTGSVTNNLRFPGQYFDSETDLHYNYYRDYNPVIGRYVEADPVGIEGGDNHLFVYVKNNPIRFDDPYGLIAPAIPAAISACAAAPACAGAVLVGSTATVLALSKLIETIEIPSEPMPNPDLSNTPERCRIDYELCKDEAEQAKCSNLSRVAKKALCWSKFLICLAGAGAPEPPDR
jgi:RHS repeat-associated protein